MYVALFFNIMCCYKLQAKPFYLNAQFDKTAEWKLQICMKLINLKLY